jgi:lipopolysaccharide biosynthesis glycosyltransferase
MKKLVFTETSGLVFSQFAQHTIPWMKKYADKIGADFLYDEKEKKLKYPLFGKYKVYDLLEEYDRILFLDIDILIRPDSPDIFELTPEDKFAAFCEGSWSNDQELLARLVYLKNIADAYGIDFSNFDMTFDYFNAGVFVASKCHKEIFSMPEENPIMSQITSEQNLLNLRLKSGGFKAYHLPICFNSMPWQWSRWYLNDSYFIHHAGGKPFDRVKAIEKDVKYLKSFDNSVV